MLYATSTDLAKRFRSDVNDEKTDVDGGDFGCLWKDCEVYDYMTDAADAVATVVGSLTKVLQLPYAAGDETVRLPRYVLDIHEARLVSRNQRLVHRNANELEPGEMFGGHGRPYEFVRDYDRQVLRLVPTPVEADVIEIQCATTPTLVMEEGIPLPFLDRKDQLLMLLMMKALAYRKHDAETEDLSRARFNEDKFKELSREREAQLRRNRRAPGTVRMNW